ncbi:MAG TPA: hypothetical protein VGO11_00805 [Chthoniobacteraceae bacterium]|jgi:hypothetical protein|nr:hypothetical protein [Chthoniobacteraceae bacterium]
MNIRFNPPQLEVARRSESLRRVVEELVPPDFQGELRVLHPFPHEPVRLVLITSGTQPLSLEVPGNWLYADLPEEEMRNQVAQLTSRLASGARRNRCAA